MSMVVAGGYGMLRIDLDAGYGGAID